jgi:large subunit ribosomal protein L15
MSFTLSSLPKTVTKTSRRLGRGPGSGKGKNSGHGHKGQIKRGGGRKAPVGFEGGQQPLVRRLPKYKGYNNKGKLNLDQVTLPISVIDSNYESGETVSVLNLIEKGLAKVKVTKARIILSGTTTKKFQFSEEIYITKGVKALM